MTTNHRSELSARDHAMLLAADVLCDLTLCGSLSDEQKHYLVSFLPELAIKRMSPTLVGEQSEEPTTPD